MTSPIRRQPDRPDVVKIRATVVYSSGKSLSVERHEPLHDLHPMDSMQYVKWSAESAIKDLEQAMRREETEE